VKRIVILADEMLVTRGENGGRETEKWRDRKISGTRTVVKLQFFRLLFLNPARSKMVMLRNFVDGALSVDYE
jgi:hypothetical protein